MSSLKGAPSLSRPPTKGFSYDAFDDDFDDYIAPVESEEEEEHAKKEKHVKKKDKARKKSRSKKAEHQTTSTGRGEEVGTTGRRGDAGVQSAPAPAVGHDSADDAATQYSDDFEDDDAIPAPASPSVDRAGELQRARKGEQEEEERLERIAEEKMREARESHERQVRQWQLEQERAARAMQQQQEELRAQMEELKRLQEQKTSEAEQGVKPTSTTTAPAGDDKNDNFSTAAAERQQFTEQQRRRLRERERAVHLRRLEQEEAARTLFQRLAQDVREVFHELNLSVVASEKERLIKDERYRKEREAKDRRDELELQERMQKEAKEREEREAKFWGALETRETRFREFLEAKTLKDEAEREARWKRDLEDREARLRSDKDVRSELDRMDKERRDREDKNTRERDRALIQNLLDDVKRQYETQMEEARRQSELDRAHAEEMHRMELAAIEKRHAEAAGQSDRLHMQQIQMLESHTGNAARLEKIIEQMHSDMEATKKMNATLTEERLTALRQKEQLIDEQKSLVETVVEELKYTKQELEKERARVASLYAKFDISLSNFTKEAAEERRRCQEAQSHYETLRQQLEKDRKMMLYEVSQERKAFEQQYEEFMAKKLQAMSELQEERMAIARERTEAAMLRERHNTDEMEVLKSLRAQEEAYAAKVETIDEDRLAVKAMRCEQKRLLDEASAEREALRKEREAFESDKNELLRRFEELQFRAAEAGATHDRLRREVELNSTAKAKPKAAAAAGWAPTQADSAPAVGAVSRLQIDLSRQRAILKRISQP
ncbi:trichohyalin [Trypanosoma conorhini]|uniref:Trichohyalin n=1 Tax=Trypanosoma conorhini TaxID=83891 RepID=A0A3R7M239_9TRYP|nr:trichohyalin [Trypanosoma conorhini]RNF25138.1 trichohyalin [Trypanosoma conorhini]